MTALWVVDDEPLARQRLLTLVRELQPTLAPLQGVALREAADAQAAQAAAPGDVVLLDIQMPGESGLALARRWRARPEGAPVVVFVTAHAEHALAAFDVEAADYLTKPVRRERLQAALLRALARTAPAAGDAAVLTVHDRGQLMRVPLAEIVYLKAELKYVTLHTTTRTHVLDEALSELEPRLGEAVVRIHRSAVVARAAVRELARRRMLDDAGVASDTWAVRVAPLNVWLPVSRRQLAAVRAALG